MPLSPRERRVYAFAIDIFSVGLLGSFFGRNWFAQTLILLFFWLILRVVVVERNRGQSLGRWLLDIRVIDWRFNRTPGLQELLSREAIAGSTATLALLGIYHGLPNLFSALLLSLPLLIDCGLAFSDSEYSQTFHDQIARTIVVQTRRGFSLDLRLKKLWLDWQKRQR
jgi:uncharacterized RDD family membrane protein YckC